jgi:thiol-disulfide isomerase/thioredoxin
MKSAVVLIVLLLAACAPIEPEVGQQESESLPSEDEMAEAPPQSEEQTQTIIEPRPNISDQYEFQGIHRWYNLEDIVPEGRTTLTRADLAGKVVLVDIWTYSCINCIRTLPYLTSWNEKYREQGLVIVGIHSPEFSFEKKTANVQAAIEKHNIQYPVGMDNDFVTWKSYKNRWWPHTYLFDRDGQLVFDHIGEGEYEEIERRIQQLLAVKTDMTEVSLPDYRAIKSPEIYLGGAINRGHVAYDLTPGEHNFIAERTLEQNIVYLNGSWRIGQEVIESTGGELILRYNSRDIHVVAGGSGEINYNIDGGSTQSVAVSGNDLYTLSSSTYAEHTLVMQPAEGVQLYTFTFG